VVDEPRLVEAGDQAGEERWMEGAVIDNHGGSRQT
jgi:hypothetical protein